MRTPDLVIEFHDINIINLLIGDILVYAWRNEKEYIYVGCTQKGIKRILTNKNRKQFNGESKELAIWKFNNKWEALIFEAELISKVEPLHNIHHNKKNKVSIKSEGKKLIRRAIQMKNK
jgi:excinuclease UvrABC nuclease subunit